MAAFATEWCVWSDEYNVPRRKSGGRRSRRAVTIAREAGYLPVERIAGGRAAVFHEGTISFSHAIRAGGGSYAGTHERFAAMATTIAAAGSALGADARVGEVPGEYCPGEFSVNSGGRIKLAGIGQRMA